VAEWQTHLQEEQRNGGRSMATTMVAHASTATTFFNILAPGEETCIQIGRIEANDVVRLRFFHRQLQRLRWKT
jgi:hypothetical protein